MGFPWRKFLNIGTDIAAATVPGGTLLDGVVDRLIEVKGKTQTDTEHIEYVLAQIAKAKAVYATKKPKGVFESKRMRVAILNALSVGLCFWGFPPEVRSDRCLHHSATGRVDSGRYSTPLNPLAGRSRHNTRDCHQPYPTSA